MIDDPELEESLDVVRRTSLEDVDIDARVEQQLRSETRVFVDEGKIDIGALSRRGPDPLRYEAL